MRRSASKLSNASRTSAMKRARSYFASSGLTTKQNRRATFVARRFELDHADFSYSGDRDDRNGAAGNVCGSVRHTRQCWAYALGRRYATSIARYYPSGCDGANGLVRADTTGDSHAPSLPAFPHQPVPTTRAIVGLHVRPSRTERQPRTA